MKKLVYIFSILFCLCCFGCDSRASIFFCFNFTSITLEVGQTINVFEQDISSNINSYAQMHIYSSNEDVVEVSNSTIQVKTKGECTITVSGNIGGRYLQDSFVVKAIEPQQEEESNGSFDIENYSKLVLSTKTIIHFSVTLNKSNYLNFTYEVILGENNILQTPTKVNNELEFHIANNSSVSIVIYNENKAIYSTFVLPFAE